MSQMQMRSAAGSVHVPLASVEALGRKLHGDLLEPTSPGYDEARAIWNAMIDRRPALIARCHTPDDVAHAVRFAREHGVVITIKGGGHNIAGLAACEAGVMADLSAMKAISVDPVTRTAEVEPGVTLAEFDAATQAHGLALPVGINSTTGIAGLTLGGGFGWTSRAFGLTIDNLLWADVILADGRPLRTSANEEPDLFWAIRGGGGNYGVVTRFAFRLHPIGPTVLAGLVVHPLDEGRAVLDHMRDCARDAPRELSTWAVLRKAPPLTFLPAEWHGREIIALAMVYAGEVAAGERATARLRSFGKPIADVVGPMPFATWQATFDPLLTPGARNYWKSHNFAALSDGLRDAMLAYAAKLPSDETEIFLAHLGGAIQTVPDEATAYGARDAGFLVNVHGRWRAAEDDDRVISWARSFYQAMTPFATGSAYMNFLTEDEVDRVPAAYGKNFARLATLKARYDPTNLFRANQNIAPAGG
ncbi:MAG TPA: FAD-binding oxidoreductase [Vicinamibacterales bacterium]|nr:FAD-binding oxidoreductase [Vicinamibacterales bacterium]